MAGRKPKPTQIKMVTGNPGKRRLNEREPQPEGVYPIRQTGLMRSKKKAGVMRWTTRRWDYSSSWIAAR